MKFVKTVTLLFLLVLAAAAGQSEIALARQAHRPVRLAQAVIFPNNHQAIRPAFRLRTRIFRKRRPVIGGFQRRPRNFQRIGQMRVPPSAALRAALSVAPGARGLGVRYLPGRGIYIVKLKSGRRIFRVVVDGRSGRVIDW